LNALCILFFFLVLQRVSLWYTQLPLYKHEVQGFLLAFGHSCFCIVKSILPLNAWWILVIGWLIHQRCLFACHLIVGLLTLFDPEASISEIWMNIILFSTRVISSSSLNLVSRQQWFPWLQYRVADEIIKSQLQLLYLSSPA
jgi:hypothetical protein